MSNGGEGSGEVGGERSGEGRREAGGESGAAGLPEAGCVVAVARSLHGPRLGRQ